MVTYRYIIQNNIYEWKECVTEEWSPKGFYLLLYAIGLRTISLSFHDTYTGWTDTSNTIYVKYVNVCGILVLNQVVDVCMYMCVDILFRWQVFFITTNKPRRSVSQLKDKLLLVVRFFTLNMVEIDQSQCHSEHDNRGDYGSSCLRIRIMNGTIRHQCLHTTLCPSGPKSPIYTHSFQVWLIYTSVMCWPYSNSQCQFPFVTLHSKHNT